MKLIDINFNYGHPEIMDTATLLVTLDREETRALLDDGYEAAERLLKSNIKFRDKKYKVIFNEPATILFVDGKKYVAKAHDEPFDMEKGLLVALMKSFGVSYLDLKRMIKNAEVQNSMEKKLFKMYDKCYCESYESKPSISLKEFLTFGTIEPKRASKMMVNGEDEYRIEKIAIKPKRHVGRPRKIKVGDWVLPKKELETCGRTFPVQKYKVAKVEDGDVLLEIDNYHLWFSKKNLTLTTPPVKRGRGRPRKEV